MSVARTYSSCPPATCFMTPLESNHSIEWKRAYETFQKVSRNMAEFIAEMKKSNVELAPDYLRRKHIELIDGIALFARRIKVLKPAETSSAKPLTEKLAQLNRIAKLHMRCLELTPEFSLDDTPPVIHDALIDFLERLEEELPFLSTATDRNVMDETVQGIFAKVIDQCDKKLDGVKIKGRALKEYLFVWNDSSGCIKLDLLIGRARLATAYIASFDFLKHVDDTKTKRKIQHIKNELEKLLSINHPSVFQSHLLMIFDQMIELCPRLLDVSRMPLLDPVFKEDFLGLMQSLEVMTDPLKLGKILLADFVLPPDKRISSNINIEELILRLKKVRTNTEKNQSLQAISKKITTELFEAAHLAIENAEISLNSDVQTQITNCIELLWDISHIIAATDNDKKPQTTYTAQLKHLLHSFHEKLRHIYIEDLTILEFLTYRRSLSETHPEPMNENVVEYVSDAVIRKSPEVLIGQLLEDLDLIRINGSYLKSAELEITRKWKLDAPDFYLSDDSDAEGT